MSYTIEMLTVGQSDTFTKTVTETDVYMFAGVSGDLNPAHTNEEYCKGTIFKTRIAHGMIGASFISAVLGNRLPGPGSIFLENTCRFKLPVFFNDTITAHVEVSEIILEKNIVKFKTKCTNQDGKVVIEGEAVLKAPKKG